MQTIIIDSSIYLSIFLGDSLYKKAIELIDPYIDNPKCKIYLPTIIISEVINVLTKRKTKEEQINNFIIAILSSPRYEILEPDFIFYIKNIRNNANNVTLKTQDLIIYFLAKEYGIDKIITTDKQLFNAYS